MEMVFEPHETLPTYQHEHFRVVEWLKMHPLLREIFLYIPDVSNLKRKSFCKNGTVNYSVVDILYNSKMGIRKGVFNFFIPLANKHYHGLWIELKRKKEKPSEENLRFQKVMRRKFYGAELAFGYEHFKNIVERYLSNYDGKNRLE